MLAVPMTDAAFAEYQARVESERQQSARRIAELETLVASLSERLAICSELLSKKAEKNPGSAEATLAGAEAVLNALFESLTHGYSFGRVVERFRELTGVKGLGEWERLQCSGGLTVNNAIFDQWEATASPETGSQRER